MSKYVCTNYRPSAAGAGRIILLMRLDNARVNVAMRFMGVASENHVLKKYDLLVREGKFISVRLNSIHISKLRIAKLVNDISCYVGFILCI